MIGNRRTDHHMLAIRKARARSASVNPRQTSSTAALCPPDGKEAFLAAIEAPPGLRIFTPSQRAETTKAPRAPGPLMVGRYGRLLERGVDGAELGAQAATDAVDCTDDRERDAGCNQAVFNGGRAGLILPETRGKRLHIKLHVYTWLVD